MNDTYSLTLPQQLVRHFPSLTRLFGDHADPHSVSLDALARSGDYFITLATKLETIAEEITEISPAATSLALSKLAGELNYLQKHYEITKKQQSDRLTELG